MAEKVTIITPTYKRSHILGKTIRSILSQTYRSFEYIILDDNHIGDTEEVRKTREVVESFADPRVRYVKNSTNLGHPNIFGKCLDLINCEYFMLYGDDDELLPESLELFVHHLESNHEISVVHGMDKFRDENGEITKPASPVDRDTIYDAELYLRSLLGLEGKFGISLSACLFRSEIITCNKIKVFGSYQWDVYFFAQYFLYSKKVAFLNHYSDIRNAAVHHTGKDGSDLYLFYIKVENLSLILKFINEYSFALAVKKININRLRLRIGFRLMVQFIHVKELSRSFLCLEQGLGSIFLALFNYAAWIVFRPLAILTGKGMALFHKASSLTGVRK
jgi:glycosyltransferase involved in cell wall biosynthesis